MTVKRAAAVLATVLVLLVAAPASGSHLLPLPPWWWDKDNDGIPEPAEATITYSPAGGAWDNTKKARLADATTVWRNSSDWNPQWNGTANATAFSVFVDGREPAGDGDCLTWAQMGEAPAVSCKTATRKTDAEGELYYDLSDVDVDINSGVDLWNYQDTSGPKDRRDFEGIMTHEVGHGARLVHPSIGCNASAPETMCVWDFRGYYARTLTNDDVISANNLY